MFHRGCNRTMSWSKISPVCLTRRNRFSTFSKYPISASVTFRERCRSSHSTKSSSSASMSASVGATARRPTATSTEHNTNSFTNSAASVCPRQPSSIFTHRAPTVVSSSATSATASNSSRSSDITASSSTNRSASRLVSGVNNCMSPGMAVARSGIETSPPRAIPQRELERLPHPSSPYQPRP